MVGRSALFFTAGAAILLNNLVLQFLAIVSAPICAGAGGFSGRMLALSHTALHLSLLVLAAFTCGHIPTKRARSGSERYDHRDRESDGASSPIRGFSTPTEIPPIPLPEGTALLHLRIPVSPLPSLSTSRGETKRRPGNSPEASLCAPSQTLYPLRGLLVSGIFCFGF